MLTVFHCFLETKPKDPQSTGYDMGIKNNMRSMENLLELAGKEKPRGRPPAAEPRHKPGRHQVLSLWELYSIT